MESKSNDGFSGQYHGIMFLYESRFLGRACRASQNIKDEIKYPTIVLTKLSNKRYLLFNSRGVKSAR